jgi:hypothetical protein
MCEKWRFGLKWRRRQTADVKELYVFELGTWEMIAELADVGLNDQAGFLPLADGRVVFSDPERGSLRIAHIAGVEVPTLGVAVDVRGQVAPPRSGS